MFLLPAIGKKMYTLLYMYTEITGKEAVLTAHDGVLNIKVTIGKYSEECRGDGTAWKRACSELLFATSVPDEKSTAAAVVRKE